MTCVSYTFTGVPPYDGGFEIHRVVHREDGSTASNTVGAVRPPDDAVVLTERLNLEAIKAGVHPACHARIVP